MDIFITILIVLLSIALVFVVLVQKSKGGGLASGFASSNSIMGAPKTTDFLEKATWYLAGSLAVICIVASAFFSSSSITPDASLDRAIEQQNSQSATPAVGLPSFGGESTEQPAEAPATSNTASSDSTAQ